MGSTVSAHRTAHRTLHGVKRDYEAKRDMKRDAVETTTTLTISPLALEVIAQLPPIQMTL